MTVGGSNSEARIPFSLSDDGKWTDFEKRDEFLSLINPINYEFKTDPGSTVVKARPISCYKDSLVLKVSDPNWTEDWAVFYFLYSNGKYFQLGSINEDLGQINERAALNITQQSLVDYMFIAGYFYVVDEQGSRFVIENADSEFIDFLPHSNQLDRQRNIEKLTPPKVQGPDAHGNFRIEVDVITGSMLERVTATVSANGDITTENVAPVLGNPESKPMRMTLHSLDTGPEDFSRALPVSGAVLRRIPGKDNPDYYLVKLDNSVQLETSKGKMMVSFLIITPYMVGDSIRPGNRLGVNMAYVIDETVIEDAELQFSKVDHVAIGFCEII